MRERGFTLVEAIMAIVITGIVAGMVAVFIRQPVDAYFDVARRSTLSDTADTALRRIGRDLRLAVPNSVRVNSTCSTTDCYLEYLPIIDGGRYRADLTSASAGDILDFASASDSSFDVLGPSVTVPANAYLVIYNTGQCSDAGCTAACTSPGCTAGANAYEGCNRRAAGVGSGNTVSFTAGVCPFPFDSAGHRFQIAGGPVTYACENVGTGSNGDGAGTLSLYTGYASAGGNWSTQPASTVALSSATTIAVLADKVSACTITYDALSATNGLVTIQLTLMRNSESVTLHHEIHVDNIP